MSTLSLLLIPFPLLAVAVMVFLDAFLIVHLGPLLLSALSALGNFQIEAATHIVSFLQGLFS